MACAIRGNKDIKGIKLPGEPGGKELEAKISMFADYYAFFIFFVCVLYDVLYHSVCFTYVATLYKPFLIRMN
jgi:hypothetical protein